MHDFLLWLTTGSNPADVNRFRGHSGIKLSLPDRRQAGSGAAAGSKGQGRWPPT